MAIQTFAGSSIAIATTSGVATYDSAGFGAKTYLIVGEVTNVGDFGKTFNVIKHNPINTRYTKKLKGSYDNGTQSVDYAYDGSNAGQTQLTAALGSDASWAIKLTLQDGTIFYYTVQVTAAPFKTGSVDSIVMGSATFEIDSDIVTV